MKYSKSDISMGALYDGRVATAESHLKCRIHHSKLVSRNIFHSKLFSRNITQILREINFEYSRSAKSAILTHLETLHFKFYEFLHIFKLEIYQMNKIHSS